MDFEAVLTVDKSPTFPRKTVPNKTYDGVDQPILSCFVLPSIILVVRSVSVWYHVSTSTTFTIAPVSSVLRCFLEEIPLSTLLSTAMAAVVVVIGVVQELMSIRPSYTKFWGYVCH